MNRDLSEFYSLAKEAAIEEKNSFSHNLETKKRLWLKMAQELEMNGVEAKEISKQIHDAIEKQLQDVTKDENAVFNNRWYYKVLSEAGYTDPSYDHSSKDAEQDQRKNASYIEKELTGENVKERKQYIKFQQDIIEQAQANIEILKHGEYLEQDKDGKEVKLKLKWSEFFKEDQPFDTIKDIFYNDKDEWNRQRDSRQSILPKHRFLMTALSSVLTNKNLCSTYYAKVKSISDITPKKWTQYVRDVKSISDLFWMCKLEAWKWNFLDIPCPDCKEESLMIKILESGDWKFVCTNWTVHAKQKNYDQDDKCMYYEPSLFSDRIKQLQLNNHSVSTKYLTKRQISTPKY